MRSFEHRIRPFETDIFGLAPPSMLLRLAVEAYMGQITAENAEREKRRRELGAVWMLARLRLEQYKPIEIGDKLLIETSPGFVEGGTYVCTADFSRGGDEVASCQIATMAVLMSARRIIRPSVLGDFPDTPDNKKPASRLKKLRIDDDMEPIGSYKVRYSDCDLNGHLSGANYADIICDCAGYWQAEPKLMAYLQIDYNSECLPGELISLSRRREEEKTYIRGIKSDGVVSFASECIIR